MQCVTALSGNKFILNLFLWNMFSQLLSSLFSATSRMLPSRKETRHFSTRPLSTTPISITVASELPPLGTNDQIQIVTESVPTVGNLKESLHQVISISLFLSTSWMKASVVSLKRKISTFAQSAVACTRQISPVISKSKEYMLQTIWTKWWNTKSKKSDTIVSSETLLSFPSKILVALTWRELHWLTVGTLVIHCSTQDGRLEMLSQHEYDLLERISQELRLDGTHILNLEECMMAYGKVYDTWLVGKNESSKRNDYWEIRNK